jgi:hypothetical protein
MAKRGMDDNPSNNSDNAAKSDETRGDSEKQIGLSTGLEWPLWSGGPPGLGHPCKAVAALPGPVCEFWARLPG